MGKVLSVHASSSAGLAQQVPGGRMQQLWPVGLTPEELDHVQPRRHMQFRSTKPLACQLVFRACGQRHKSHACLTSMQVRDSAQGENGEFVFAFAVEVLRDQTEDLLEGRSLQAVWIHHRLQPVGHSDRPVAHAAAAAGKPANAELVSPSRGLRVPVARETWVPPTAAALPPRHWSRLGHRS